MRRLCTHGKLIIMNNQIVITTTLYAKIIKTLHSGHHGVSSMIACTNTTIYKEVRDTRFTCHLCNETYSQQKEPFMLTPPASLFSDYFELAIHCYLAVTGRFSGWLNIYHFPPHKTIAATLITICQGIFILYVVPEELKADGDLSTF